MDNRKKPNKEETSSSVMIQGLISVGSLQHIFYGQE